MNGWSVVNEFGVIVIMVMIVDRNWWWLRRLGHAVRAHFLYCTTEKSTPN